MNLGQTVFSQVVDYLPRYEFLKCVSRYRGDYQQKSFSCWDQYLAMAFAQLTYRESLRDYRSMPAVDERQALPHGVPQSRGTLYAGGSQRVARLAHLCRFRASAHRHCATAVCPQI